MANTPRFLDKLVNMTSMHDLELMEYSLLKTIEEFIHPHQLLILRFDRNGQPTYRASLKKGQYEIVWEDIHVPDEINTAVEIVSTTKRPFSRHVDHDKMLTVWHVLQPKGQEVFLVTQTKSRLNNLDTHMVNGLLGVYRNFYAVLSESQRDGLTGLPNRKTFEETINKIYFEHSLPTEDVVINRRVQLGEDDKCYWLGMADIDYFKRINDTWGHLYGDEVLLLISQLMQSHFRANDYLFRYGGEEFVIILCAPDLDHARRAFERFRVAVQEYRFPQVGQITMSIGSIKMDPHIFTTTLLDYADKALYYAKNNGRNQVSFYDELLQHGLLEEQKIVTGEIELF
ncbi:MAG: GGDEF domain-containing protein [Desulfuromonadaceae bacterium]|nr:GGDEF domain-containing protein [Desulfuromonadaceae bacterium]